MKKTILIGSVLFLLAACYPKPAWEQRNIKSMEDNLLNEARKGKMDSAALVALLQSYESYADRNPGDKQAAAYLFKAADFYRYMGKPLRSIVLYEKVYDKFPAFDKRAYALFLQGFVFENEVGNIEAARLKYHQFLARYPKHEIADDVRTSLRNLGKSPEELIREFKAREQLDSLQVQAK